MSQTIPMRKIIHLDCDCFFAAVEMRDDPSLGQRPIAVGGRADRRGVISTCNYPARAYGVHSAMATATAMKLCPDLIMVPHNMDKYRLAAEQIREIFSDYSDVIEPLSLDEAFLDVSGVDNATEIAREICQRVSREVGISISAGVAPNKFLAKIGSDWNKPNGLCVIPPHKLDAFVQQLPVEKLFGVGKVTARRLHQMGVTDCASLRPFSVFELTEQFGSFGQRLYELCRGIDERPVKSSRRRKSLSVEHTYAADFPGFDGCLSRLPALYEKLCRRLSNMGSEYPLKKQFVKIKFSNFQSTTMECLASGTPQMDVFHELYRQSMQRGNGLPIRLLGMGVRFQDADWQSSSQLSLFA
jgi:DNA polymerase-4